MKPLSVGIGAAVLALSLAASTAVPAFAAPPGPCAGPNCAQGQGWNKNGPNWNNNGPNWNNRGKFERRGNYAYFNNHRGFRDRHPGYRYYNGFWFPPAAFIFGTIVGSTIANSQGSGYSAHVAWCEDHYRSYRQYDNTWQPYNGPRQVCISPYSG